MKEFFENLKSRREQNNIPLEEVHRRTRLPMKYLSAIESGNMDELPNGYERIYLKRYAKEIRIDVEEVMQDYDLLTGRLAPAEPDVPPAGGLPREESAGKNLPALPARRPRLYSKRRLWDKWDSMNLDRMHKIFWVALGIFLLGTAGYFLIQQYRQDKSSRELTIREITLPDLIKENNPAESAAADTPLAVTPDTTLTPRFSVRLQTFARTWVQEIRDQKDTIDYTLLAGNQHIIAAAEEIQLLLGRADGVGIWVDRDSLGIMGDSTQIAFLTLTPRGLAHKRLRNVKPPGDDLSGSTAGQNSDPRQNE